MWCYNVTVIQEYVDKGSNLTKLALGIFIYSISVIRTNKAKYETLFKKSKQRLVLIDLLTKFINFVGLKGREI